jgi:hypothetical protein
MDLADTFAAIIADARHRSGLTAAEFDYAMQATLSATWRFGDRAQMALGNAVYDAANLGFPEVTEGAHDVAQERGRRADELHEQLRPLIADLIAEAGRKSYVGWSSANSGPIQYA